MNEEVNYKNDIVDQDEDLELFQQLLDNNPTLKTFNRVEYVDNLNSYLKK